LRPIQRIPSALEITADELRILRAILTHSFMPANQVDLQTRSRLLELDLIQCALGGLMVTPAGRIVSRF
jgi:hypothetical protein